MSLKLLTVSITSIGGGKKIHLRNKLLMILTVVQASEKYYDRSKLMLNVEQKLKKILNGKNSFGVKEKLNKE